MPLDMPPEPHPTPRHARLEVVADALAAGIYGAPSDQPHHVRLVYSNGEISMHSESYDNRSNADRAIWDIINAFREIIAEVDKANAAVIDPAPQDYWD